MEYARNNNEIKFEVVTEPSPKQLKEYDGALASGKFQIPTLPWVWNVPRATENLNGMGKK